MARDWQTDLGRSSVAEAEAVRIREASEAASAAVVAQADRLREDARSVAATASSLIASMAAGSQAAAHGAVSSAMERLTVALDASSGRYAETASAAVRETVTALAAAVRAAQPSVSVAAAQIDLVPIGRAIEGIAPTVVVDLAPVAAAVDRLADAQAATQKELRAIRETMQASIVAMQAPRYHSIRYDGERIAGVTSASA
jgi:hypothetical protein